MKLIVNSLIKLGILKRDLDYHLIRISRRLRGFCITKMRLTSWPLFGNCFCYFAASEATIFSKRGSSKPVAFTGVMD